MMKYLTLFLFCLYAASAAALKPSKQYHSLPDARNFPGWQQKILDKQDGFPIATWYFPPMGADRKITVVVAGGDGGNMADWLHLAKALTAHGFTVLCFDYRGFGRSADFSIDTARLYYNEFGDDLKAAARYAQSLHPGNKLAIYGFSMGTLLATRVWPELRADYFIGEGFVADPVVLQRRIKALKGRSISLPSDAARHSEKLTSLPASMLLFGGTGDPVTTVADCKALAATHPRLVMKTFDGGHGGGFNALMKSATDGAYVQAIIHFTTK